MGVEELLAWWIDGETSLVKRQASDVECASVSKV
jgi:hypothetical protein